MPKLQILRRRKKISQSELALKVGIERNIISLIEGYKALPTPEVLIRIEQAMELDRLQIFDKEEIRLLKKQRNKHTIPEDYPYFHIHVVLDRKLKHLFTKETLSMAGYSSLNHWFMKKVESYIKQLEHITLYKEKKDSSYHANDNLRDLFEDAKTFTHNIPKKRSKVNFRGQSIATEKKDGNSNG